MVVSTIAWPSAEGPPKVSPKVSHALGEACCSRGVACRPKVSRDRPRSRMPKVRKASAKHPGAVPGLSTARGWRRPRVACSCEAVREAQRLRVARFSSGWDSSMILSLRDHPKGLEGLACCSLSRWHFRRRTRQCSCRFSQRPPPQILLVEYGRSAPQCAPLACNCESPLRSEYQWRISSSANKKPGSQHTH